jgi:hypothetical protein
MPREAWQGDSTVKCVGPIGAVTTIVADVAPHMRKPPKGVIYDDFDSFCVLNN